MNIAKTTPPGAHENTTLNAPKQRKKIAIQAYIMLIALMVIWLFFGLMTTDWEYMADAANLSEGIDAILSGYLSPRNLSNLFRAVSITGITAIGMVFVIISCEIDLSVGSLLGLIVGIGAILDSTLGLGPLLVIPSMLLIGLLLGLFNGWWIAYRGVPSFIVTLAGMLAFRGLVTLLLGSKNVTLSNTLYRDDIASGYLDPMLGWVLVLLLGASFAGLTMMGRKSREKYGLTLPPIRTDILKVIAVFVGLGFLVFILNAYRGLSVPLIIMGVLAVVFTWMAKSTVHGRHIYAMGGNNEAARLSGVNVRRTKLFVFGANGFLVAAAAVILMSRLDGASPTAGNGQELYTIAACFIGGTSMRGGIGTVFGAITGALIMESLRNGMQFLGVDSSWQDIIMGAVLLLAVYFDIASRQGDFSRYLNMFGIKRGAQPN